MESTSMAFQLLTERNQPWLFRVRGAAFDYQIRGLLAQLQLVFVL